MNRKSAFSYLVWDDFLRCGIFEENPTRDHLAQVESIQLSRWGGPQVASKASADE